MSSNGMSRSGREPTCARFKVFLTLAEELHFGRAAERLQLNRSRVSQIISGLEPNRRPADRNQPAAASTHIRRSRLRDNLSHPYDLLERGVSDARAVATGDAGTLRIGI
jgi:Bacterial regulatory helix-turn-helix protein, lysR family